MKLKTLRTALAVGAIAAASGYAIQASGAPTFTFTEVGGFQVGDVGSPPVQYLNPVAPSAIAPPEATAPGLALTMQWVFGVGPSFSSLELATDSSGSAIGGAWVPISRLTHNNFDINLGDPPFTGWSNQNVFGRFIITDSDGGALVVLDNTNTILLDFTETSNHPVPDVVGSCPAPNPNGSKCDDFFVFSAGGLDPIDFFANDGSKWQVQFDLSPLAGGTQIGNVVYTAEGQSDTIEVLARVVPLRVPEPGTLTLLGISLIGLGFVAWRRQGGAAA